MNNSNENLNKKINILASINALLIQINDTLTDIIFLIIAIVCVGNLVLYIVTTKMMGSNLYIYIMTGVLILLLIYVINDTIIYRIEKCLNKINIEGKNNDEFK